MSRPEPEIRDKIAQYSSRAITRLVLHEIDKGTVQSDIETYLRESLGPIDPSESVIAALVQRAGVLFIHAAATVRYIGYDNFGRSPRSRLEDILSSTPAGNGAYKEIDEIYRRVLEVAIDNPQLNDREKEDIKQVLNTVLCAREPLTVNSLSGLLGVHDPCRVHAALRPLWSVLRVVESSGLIALFHTSFSEYMFDSGRSKGYCCDLATQHQLLARCSFNCIKNANPQFNVCGLESSYLPDDRIADLSERVVKAIPPELYYACRYWETHLELATGSSDLIEPLEDFLSARLLLWMEIMNLRKCMSVAVGVVQRAEEWCNVSAPRGVEPQY